MTRISKSNIKGIGITASIIGLLTLLVILFIVGFYCCSQNFNGYTLFVMGCIYLVPCVSTLIFSICLIVASCSETLNPKRVITYLKCQLTAIKSAFTVVLGFLAVIALFSTDDDTSNKVMSDSLFWALAACLLFSIPFFCSTYVLNVLEEGDEEKKGQEAI